MPRDVQVAAEEEEVWFEHPAGPANLFFRASVKGGVLRIEGFHCAYGLARLEVINTPTGIALIMPNPPVGPKRP